MKVLVFATFVLPSIARAGYSPGTTVKLEKQFPLKSYGEIVCGPPPVGSIGKVVRSALSTSDMPMVLWENRSNCSVSEERTLVPSSALQATSEAPAPKDDDLEAGFRKVKEK